MSATEIYDAVREQFDTSAERFTIDLDEFHSTAIPFALGYSGHSHALGSAGYADKQLTFVRIR